MTSCCRCDNDVISKTPLAHTSVWHKDTYLLILEWFEPIVTNRFCHTVNVTIMWHHAVDVTMMWHQKHHLHILLDDIRTLIHSFWTDLSQVWQPGFVTLGMWHWCDITNIACKRCWSTHGHLSIDFGVIRDSYDNLVLSHSECVTLMWHHAVDVTTMSLKKYHLHILLDDITRPMHSFLTYSCQLWPALTSHH